MSIPRVEPRETVSTEVAKKLIDYLLGGELEAGARIPSERALAKAMGIGRSTIRDALKPLTLLGLLQVRPGDGTYLMSPDSDVLPQSINWSLLLGERRVRDLLEAREVIEPALARLAAARRGDDTVEELERLLQQMERPREKKAFIEADLAFHMQIATAAENHALLGLMTSIRSLLEAWIRRVAEAAPDTGPSYEEHVPIFEAIRNADQDAAEQAMGSHLRSAHARLDALI